MRAGVVGDQQRRAVGGQVLRAADLDPEPGLHQRPQQRQEDLGGELGVEAELVDRVVAAQPGPGEAATAPPATRASPRPGCAPDRQRWRRDRRRDRAARCSGPRATARPLAADRRRARRAERRATASAAGRRAVGSAGRSLRIGLGIRRLGRWSPGSSGWTGPRPGAPRRAHRPGCGPRPRGACRLPRPAGPRLPSWMISASATPGSGLADRTTQSAESATSRPAPG